MNKIPPRYQLSIAAILAVALLGVIGAKAPRGQDPQRVNNQDEHAQLIEAVRKGGLREAAKIKGTYVISINPGWDAVFSDVESLTSHSGKVIVGIPIGSSSRISPEGDRVLTDYKVSVLEVLKGKTEPGSLETVSVLGGLILFEDGTSAEVKTPGFKIENGKTYVFFLSGRDSKTNTLQITGGPQGVFEIPINGTGIIPQGRKIDLVVQKYKGKRAERFIQEIRIAAEKWPDQSKCCQ